MALTLKQELERPLAGCFSTADLLWEWHNMHCRLDADVKAYAGA